MSNASGSRRLPRVADWDGMAAGAEARYRDGEGRVGAIEDPDTRQRQLTRMGNAAGAAGLASLMRGRSEDAGAWFGRAAERLALTVGTPAVASFKATATRLVPLG